MSRAITAMPIAAFLALGAAAGAQQPAGGSPPAGTPGASSRPPESTAPDAITLSGCVDRLPNGIFVLNDARITALGDAAPPAAGRTVPGPVGTSGVTGQSGPAGAAASADVDKAAPTRWTLESKTDLVLYVGQQVQVVGKPDYTAPARDQRSQGNQQPQRDNSSGAPAGSEDSHRPESSIPTQSVEVATVRMVSTSCP